MSRGTRRQRSLSRAEWVLATLLTVSTLLLHVGFYTRAGALWRDEVTSVDLAAMPSLSAIGGSLQYDSFPLLSTLLLRGWIAAGWGNDDLGIRAWGLLIGVAFLGALWATVRLLGCRTPLLSLALLGLNPLAVRTVGSIRPYGLGIVLIVLTLGLLWKAITSPSLWRFLAAGALAILSVQCMYQNAFLLAGVCLTGGLVAWRWSSAKSAGPVVLVGFAAAASLLPYWPSVHAARDWSILNEVSTGVGPLWRVFLEALRAGGALGTWAWVALFLLLCAIGMAALRSRARPLQAKGRVAVFGSILCVASIAIFFAALTASRLPTQPWYYVPLMAVIAPTLDAGACAAATSRAKRAARLALAALIALGALGGWKQVLERRTNMDAVAALVQKQGAPGDFILVYPWFNGVTFQRYYKGTAQWTTIPPIEDLRIHRYDLLKQKMADPNPMGPALEKMETCLKSGHRVWVVGGMPPLAGPGPPAPLPPAPGASSGWGNGPYVLLWGRQAAYFLMSHARESRSFPDLSSPFVNPLETISVGEVSGWR